MAQLFPTTGIFGGPVDDAAIALIRSWHTNAVRVPLNEDCWLGINGVDPARSGAAYQAAIVDFVQRLGSHGLYAILDLHFNAPGAELSGTQQVGPDLDHAPAFWASVAGVFRDVRGVVFDLYNEPIQDLGSEATGAEAQWTCWRDGCNSLYVYQFGHPNTPVRETWPMAGMQALVSAVRGAGATQPIMLGGLHYANDLTGWLAHLPSDPQHQLIASLHIYDINPCNSAACWDQQIAPVSQMVPVVTGELGEFDRAAGGCPGHAFVDNFMGWADAHGVSYLGWAWVVYPQCTPDSFMLIADYATDSHLAGDRPA